MSAFNTWGHFLAIGEAGGRQQIERAANPEDAIFLHPTTRRWHEIADKLRYLMQIYDRTDPINGKPVFPRATLVERQFEMLIELVDTNLAESAALMESLYPGTVYQAKESNHEVNLKGLLPELGAPENQQHHAAIRRMAIRYHYSVKKMRNEIEAAYLALYDNGRSLRFLPLQSPLVFEMGSSQNDLGVQPWASAQMVLGSGEAFIKRFFDPNLDTNQARVPITSEPGRPINIFGEVPPPENTDTVIDGEGPAMETSEAEESEVSLPSNNPLVDTPFDPEDQEAMEQALFQVFEMRDGILRLALIDSGHIGTIRTRLREILISYSSQAQAGGQYGNADFSHKADNFQQIVHETALRIEATRKTFVDENNRLMSEHFAKTAYPETLSKLLREYRYDRLHPFYWMWVFALIAVVLSGASYATAATRESSVVAKTIAIHSATHNGKAEETELTDYTNSVEEWLFLGSVVLLIFAIGIAFIGGAMRASITGWAPVTNMYETVVMTALAAAVLGMWYALYPLLHPALRQAWFYSKFPRIGILFELLAAQKKQKSLRLSRMAGGEAAMREAAADFGIPGGMPFSNRHTVSVPQQDPEEIETVQRVRVARRKIVGQCLLAVPRLVLTFSIFYAMVVLANGEHLKEYGFVAASINMFATNDTIDMLTVVASVLLFVWFVPHVLLTLLIMPILLFCPSWIAAELGIRSFEKKISVETADHLSGKSRITQPRSMTSSVLLGEGQNALLGPQDTSGAAWLKQARNAILDRKLFIAITAAIVFKIALIADWNAEFNPDIRPIMPVLRSNFWLTVHVVAIVVSYAAAFIAWGIAAVSLGFVVFGRYRRVAPEYKGEKEQVLLPEPCQMFSPVIELLIRMALLLLIVGTVLGARWADYSWGRFWSWDPKEVWALITILFFVIVSHGKVARYYGAIGITVGALFASIAVIITWYGINFVFQGGRHTYGGGAESNATLFLATFIAVNLLWGTLALLRYNAEVYGGDTVE
jgi:ABC-type transport system involved in cytochrome c biogenesis permease subunit